MGAALGHPSQFRMKTPVWAVYGDNLGGRTWNGQNLVYIKAKPFRRWQKLHTESILGKLLPKS